MGAGEYSFEGAPVRGDTSDFNGFTIGLAISNPTPPDNPYPEGGGTAVVDDGSVYWAKQSNELARYVSTAPSDSTGTIWWRVQASQDARFNVGVPAVPRGGEALPTGISFVETFMPGEGPSDYNSSALSGVTTHGGVAVYIGGTSADSPGTKIAEGYGTLDILGADGGGVITAGALTPVFTENIEGPVDFYFVFEVYGDSPPVINWDGEPTVRFEMSVEGPLPALVDRTLYFVDNVLHVEVTIRNGVGPFTFAMDWDDGSDPVVDTFDRDPSFTTTRSWTHAYAPHDYELDEFGGPRTVTVVAVDDGLIYGPPVVPSHQFFEGTDLGTGYRLNVSDISLPVPDLILDAHFTNSPDDLYNISAPPGIASFTVTDTAVLSGIADNGVEVGAGVSDVEYDWYWTRKTMGSGWGASDESGASPVKGHTWTLPGEYYGSVRVRNSVGWWGGVVSRLLTVGDGPNLATDTGPYRVAFE